VALVGCLASDGASDISGQVMSVSVNGATV
jgi:hypothetical protein